MQLQADFLGRPVDRLDIPEIGALGVVSMAAEAVSLRLSAASSEAQMFLPRISEDKRQYLRDAWRAAVAKAAPPN